MDLNIFLNDRNIKKIEKNSLYFVTSCLRRIDIIPPDDPELSFQCDTRRDVLEKANYSISCCKEDLCNDDKLYAKNISETRASGKGKILHLFLGACESLTSFTVIVNIKLSWHLIKTLSHPPIILGSSTKSSFCHL